MKKLIMLCLLSCSLSFAQNMTCVTPFVFRGVDDGTQAFAVLTFCQPQNVPPVGTFFASAEVVYVLLHPMAVSGFTTWLGTAQFSVEETSGEITIEVPNGSGGFITKAIIVNQKDKHTDVEGERITQWHNGTYNLPAGSRIHFFMNMGIANATSSCPLGCAVQLNVYLNPPAS